MSLYKTNGNIMHSLRQFTRITSILNLWIHLGYKKVWIFLITDSWFTSINLFTILNFVLFFPRYMYLLCVIFIALRFNVCFCKKNRKCFWEKNLINNRKSLGVSKGVNIHSFTPPHKLP